MSSDSSKLATLKTYMLIAFIFNILAMIGFGIAGLLQIVSWATWAGIDYFGVLTGLLIWGIIYLVLAGVAFWIFFTRVSPMYKAANTGNVATLKALNNQMWAIIALIFAGVLPGIMLLISFPIINELGQSPPPPPPM